MITYFLIGLVVGTLFVILALALCKTSARCSPAEQAAMDDEQARGLAGWQLGKVARGEAKWKTRKDGE